MSNGQHNPDNMGMTQMLEAGKISDFVDDLLNKYKISNVDIESACRCVFVDEDMVDTWTDITAENRLNDMEPWDIDWIIPDFRKDLIKQSYKLSLAPPNLSAVGVRKPPSANVTDPLFTKARDIFSLGVRPGGATVITGVPGSGKTSIASQYLLDDSLKMENWFTTTNMYSPIREELEKKYDYQYASKLSKSLEVALKWDLSGYNDLIKRCNDFIFDEQQVGRDRQKAGTSENISLKHLSLIIRKIGGHQRVIYQQNKVPSEIFDFATHWINKPSFTNKGLVHYRNEIYNFHYKIHGVKGVEQREADGEPFYPFESEHFAPMSVDIFVDKAYTYLAGFDNLNSEGLKREFLKYIDKVKGEATGTIPRESVKEMAYYCHVNGIGSQDKILKKLSQNITKLAMFFGLDEPSGIEAGRKELSRYFKKREAEGGKPEIREPEDIIDVDIDKFDSV